MKILFSITYYHPYTSGLSIYAKRMAEALVRRGYDINVICIQHDRSLPINENIKGVNIQRVPYIFRINKGFISIRWLIRCISEVKNIDSIVIHLPQMEGLIPAIIGKILNKKVICVYHCDVVLPENPVNSFIQTILDAANHISLICADRIIGYTKDYAASSRVLSKYFNKTEFILPPVPKPVIDIKVKGRLTNQIGKSKYRIGIAARLAREKGIEYVIEALPQIADKLINSKKIKNAEELKLVVAGPRNPVGESSYRKHIDSLVEKYKEQIIFLGNLSQGEIGSFYSLLDVLVLPSVNATEAFGMVQVEAILCGVAVVASNLPGVRVPIQLTGMGKLVEPKDVKRIAESIYDLMVNKVIIKPENIRKIFSLKNTVDQFEKVINAI